MLWLFATSFSTTRTCPRQARKFDVCRNRGRAHRWTYELAAASSAASGAPTEGDETAIKRRHGGKFLTDAVARLMADFERFREAVTKCVDFTAPKVKSAAVAVDGCIRPIIVKAMEQPAEKPPHKSGASSSLLDKLDSPPLSPRLNATIAFEEAAFGAANDAEILRRQLIRTQTLCANQLYDVQLRCTLRLCFRALQKAGGAPPAAEAAPSDETPRRSRKLLGYDETLAPGEPAPLVPYGGSPDMTFLSPHQRRLLQDPFLLGLNGSAGGGMSGLRDGLSNRTSKSGGRYGITPTMAVALESAEHEERRDAQLYGFIQRFRTEKERLGTMASLQRVRTTARLCLHALRSHAAERVAWRGTKYGVALTAIMGNRTIVWTAFIAWRMDTRRESREAPSDAGGGQCRPAAAACGGGPL